MIPETLAPHWVALRPYLSIQSEADYDRAVNQLNDLLDEIGTDESHPLYEFLDTLGSLLHLYEEEHEAIPEVTGLEILHYLMEEHGLRQADLSEIGSQGVVSEILNGKRTLNVRQIRALSNRFQVSPAVFI
jgi:HTH-type transcriptional regulator/antitoxin HigA